MCDFLPISNSEGSPERKQVTVSKPDTIFRLQSTVACSAVHFYFRFSPDFHLSESLFSTRAVHFSLYVVLVALALQHPSLLRSVGIRERMVNGRSEIHGPHRAFHKSLSEFA